MVVLLICIKNLVQKSSRKWLEELSHDMLPSELASFFSQHAHNLRRCTAKFNSTLSAYFLCGPRGTVASSEKPNARGPAVIGCLPSMAGNREGEGLISLMLIAPC
jgi:hypothetical protein